MENTESGRERALCDGKNLANQGEYAARVRRCLGVANGLVQALEALERLLTLTNEVLKVTQPPVSGKLGVQWWIPRGGADWRDPTLVKWRRLQNGRSRAYAVKHLHPNMVRREGTSKYGAEATLDLARVAVRLIAAYKETRSRLLALTSRARVPSKLQSLLAEAKVAVYLNHQDVMKALIKAGYEIDAKTMRLTGHLAD